MSRRVDLLPEGVAGHVSPTTGNSSSRDVDSVDNMSGSLEDAGNDTSSAADEQEHGELQISRKSQHLQYEEANAAINALLQLWALICVVHTI